jgi:hypothetical protein
MTMNQLDFIKGYLKENFGNELPIGFWEVLDEVVTSVRKTVEDETSSSKQIS